MKDILASEELLLFTVGTMRLGVPVAALQEVVRGAGLAPLPRAPEVVEGILNLRGQLVPVLDLRRRFRLPTREPLLSDHFLVLEVSQRTVAFRVDRAEGLIFAPPSARDASVTELPGVGYVAGAVKLEDGVVLIADVSAFLNEAESLDLGRALDASQRSEPR